MILMVARLDQGTYIGEVKQADPANESITSVDGYDITKLLFPVMLDFITMQAPSRLGTPDIRTTLHMSNWPYFTMTLEKLPAFYSLIDTVKDGNERVSPEFVKAYMDCRKNAWPQLKIIG